MNDTRFEDAAQKMLLRIWNEDRELADRERDEPEEEKGDDDFDPFEFGPSDTRTLTAEGRTVVSS